MTNEVRNFLVKIAEIEFKAIKDSEKFYMRVWKPWSESKGLETDSGEWNVGCPPRFKEWIKFFGKDSDYPWKVYLDFYDNHLEEWALA